jgi:hypothetical protein
MRLYVAEIAQYLTELIPLIGQDEHRCHACGVRNVEADGRRLHGSFMVWSDGAAFCESHRAEFLAHSEAERAAREAPPEE